MQDADGSVPLFWGTDSEGRLVLSNDEDVMKKSCGKSFAQFPKGNANNNKSAFSMHSLCFRPLFVFKILVSLLFMIQLGCFFTTSGGLQSFEHPLSEVKPVPRVDSKGEVCGATYTVDAGTKKDSSIPRVGSAANWASQF